ncbi:MFS transporter [Massilia putida]|uniref:MFS transporter n=1 Tax=Massilia putida TaxID=1141883 RepID=UPI000951E5AF|nr:MFS transporter [Massilia putida]
MRFLVVNDYPARRIAKTLSRVVGVDEPFSAATRYTVSEQKVQSKTKAQTPLTRAFRGINLSLWATYFMGLMVTYLLSGWLPILIMDAGLSIERVASITALFQLGGTVGTLVVGCLVDRWARIRRLPPTSAAPSSSCC